MNKTNAKKAKFGKIDIVWAILSILASVLIWLVVTGQENTMTSITLNDVPLVFIGEDDALRDRNLLITDRSTENVTLTLRLKRGEESKISVETVHVTVDLGDIRNAGVSDKMYQVTYEGLEDSEVEIVSKYPETVSVTVEQEKTMFIPVKLDPLPDDCTQDYFSEDRSAGRYILAAEQPDFEPKQIRVTGPDSVVSQIDFAKVTIDRHNLTETTTGYAGFTLINTDGSETDVKRISKMNPDLIEYTIPVEMEKTVPLRVRIIPGCGATEENAEVTIGPPVVTLTGDEKYLEVINEIVLGSIDLSGFIQPSTQTFAIPLPANATNRSGETTASVAVDFVGVTTKTITTSDIHFDNVPEDCVVKLKTDPLEFIVRGPEKRMPLVDSSSFQVRADVGPYADRIGLPFTVPVTILIYGHNDVGVFGDYTVTLTLEPDLPEETFTPEEASEQGQAPESEEEA